MTNTDDNPETSGRESGQKEELFAHFNQAITTVKLYTHHFENEVARPAVDVFFDVFEERPILATFLAILILLSFFPILTFITASGVTLVSFVAFALVISLSSSFAVIIAFLLALISTLLASVFVAAIATNICFNIYFAFRLFVLVRQKGASEGFSCWIGEIWSHCLTVGSFALHAIPFSRRVVYHAYSANMLHRRPNESTEDSTDYDIKVKGPGKVDGNP